jgi:hypothetical protein
MGRLRMEQVTGDTKFDDETDLAPHAGCHDPADLPSLLCSTASRV